jgi:hypothetical protein
MDLEFYARKFVNTKIWKEKQIFHILGTTSITTVNRCLWNMYLIYYTSIGIT